MRLISQKHRLHLYKQAFMITNRRLSNNKLSFLKLLLTKKDTQVSQSEQENAFQKENTFTS